MKHFITKNKLKKELQQERCTKLKYKNKLSLIEYKLREQKETNGNVFTLLRDLNEIIYKQEVKCDMEPRKCPRCGKVYLEYPAISRKDNKTEICPECGLAEALIQASGKSLDEDIWKYNRKEN